MSAVRPTEDPYGGATFADLGDTKAVVSLGAATVTTGFDYRQAGTVFTPRGLDRKEGDRFTHNGLEYTLVGPARGDQPHPFTGDDFGWVAHAIERSN
ncbi:hypothetical protein OF855_24490 [Mycolicibacterium fortuitum]|uniref:hypothetical protein n=1 Tax=Mycolicibacterium fortuitum TaxID=1766 RepID=UPI0022BA239F|nr:hypothetical protein [Mycolicibacterium fortuitum]WAY18399.1 hypothetical protein OF855_24490 [Mycolicibacterium fortuitum]